MAERADNRAAPVDGALHGLGACGVANDERDAIVDRAGLRLLAHERRDLAAGGERLSDEFAADAAGRAEDGELHVAASPSKAGIPEIGSTAAS